MPLFWTFVNAGCIYMKARTLIKLFYPLIGAGFGKQLLGDPAKAFGIWCASGTLLGVPASVLQRRPTGRGR